MRVKVLRAAASAGLPPQHKVSVRWQYLRPAGGKAITPRNPFTRDNGTHTSRTHASASRPTHSIPANRNRTAQVLTESARQPAQPGDVGYERLRSSVRGATSATTVWATNGSAPRFAARRPPSGPHQRQSLRDATVNRS